MRTSRTSTWLASALVVTCLVAATFAGSAGAGEPGPGAVATDTVAVTHAQDDRVPEGAAWTQPYFPSSDRSDTELHADVLRPEGLPAGEKVPVILVVSAYVGHSGQLFPEGFTHTGPSSRFADFMTGTGLFARGYAFVKVDTAVAAGLISRGELHIPVEKSYTLADAAAAHIDSQAGHTRGRRVVLV